MAALRVVKKLPVVLLVVIVVVDALQFQVDDDRGMTPGMMRLNSNPACNPFNHMKRHDSVATQQSICVPRLVMHRKQHQAFVV
jgi:hypothetical protein